MPAYAGMTGSDACPPGVDDGGPAANAEHRFAMTRRDEIGSASQGVTTVDGGLHGHDENEPGVLITRPGTQRVGGLCDDQAG